MKKGLIFSIVGLFSTAISAATYYMPDDFPNLHSALSNMLGGDILIIRDGIYRGEANAIDDEFLPPSGFDDRYTTIKAEHDWSVVFDGENQRSMFYTWVSRNHIKFEGIKWINSNDSSLHIYQWDHVKFLRCAFNCGSNALRVSTAWVSQSSYVLFEDCHAWGDGRYSLNIQISDHVIIRRFVSRLDGVNATNNGGPYPSANFMSYASQDVEWQNCIAVDTDQDSFRSPASYYLGGFATHALYQGEYTERNIFRGCIALNIDMHEPNPNYSGSIGPGFSLDRVRLCTYLNCIAWDIVGRGFSGISLEGYNSTIDHCTAKILHDPNGNGDVINANDMVSVTNSVLLNGDRTGIRGGAFSNYNCLYQNAHNYSLGSEQGESDILNIDPLDGEPGNGVVAIKYICRIEAGSDLKGRGSNGDIGANVIYRIGRSGSLYGEDGYNEETEKALWPYPFEDVIKQDFKSYNGFVTGNRGFCEDKVGLYGGPLTLTSYIWEYLGNACPADICNYCDINQDGSIDINDVQLVANVILGKDANSRADVNGDGSVTISDVQEVVNSIIG